MWGTEGSRLPSRSPRPDPPLSQRIISTWWPSNWDVGVSPAFGLSWSVGSSWVSGLLALRQEVCGCFPGPQAFGPTLVLDISSPGLQLAGIHPPDAPAPTIVGGSSLQVQVQVPVP